MQNSKTTLVKQTGIKSITEKRTLCDSADFSILSADRNLNI